MVSHCLNDFWVKLWFCRDQWLKDHVENIISTQKLANYLVVNGCMWKMILGLKNKHALHKKFKKTKRSKEKSKINVLLNYCVNYFQLNLT